MERKTLSLNECDIKLADDTGRFAGYASVFEGVDAYGDTIVKGAYDHTLRTHGQPKMFVQHDSSGLPIGKWISIKEDDHGLLVEGEFTPGMARAEEARAALMHGTVDGLSIGYLLKKGDFEDKPDKGRVIRRVSKLVEVSIVAFPADAGARIDLASVKHEVEQLETIRDFERLLRDVGGLDQVTAKRLVTKAKELFRQRDVGEDAQAQASDDSLARALVLRSSTFLEKRATRPYTSPWL